MRKAFPLLVLFAVVALGLRLFEPNHVASTAAADVQDPIASAFANHRSGIEVTGRGVVTRILADDRNGRLHQRFILRLPSGQTLLIAHNIALADRVAGLKKGDVVQFKGEYEWNAQGGVVHWTHADPRGRHPAGWLELDGRAHH